MQFKHYVLSFMCCNSSYSYFDFCFRSEINFSVLVNILYLQVNHFYGGKRESSLLTFVCPNPISFISTKEIKVNYYLFFKNLFQYV